MADAIVASVRRFCGDAPQYDDITLVAAKVR
jgi:serine phosphatase RsbU (regulator of sigma subunit)